MWRAVLDRERAGVTGSRFGRQVSRSEDLVRRLEKIGTLDGHSGCVNTVSFCPTGDTLVSGSDDRNIIFWNWQTGEQRLCYASGHRNNVFQARIMPNTYDRTVVTCAADGQVRIGYVAEGGGKVETKKLALHSGRAHKLALEPESPACFFSCAEDGEVRHFDLRQPACANRKLLVCRASRSQHARPIDLNAIHCNPTRPWQFVVGGSDEAVRVYDQRRVPGASTGVSGAEGVRQPPPSHSASIAEPVRKLTPAHLATNGGAHSSIHITCVMFSCTGELVATYNDEDIYLFAPDTSSGRGRAISSAKPRPAAPASPSKRPRSAGSSGGDRGVNGGNRGANGNAEARVGGDGGGGVVGHQRLRRRRQAAADADADAGLCEIERSDAEVGPSAAGSQERSGSLPQPMEASPSGVDVSASGGPPIPRFTRAEWRALEDSSRDHTPPDDVLVGVHTEPVGELASSSGGDEEHGQRAGDSSSDGDEDSSSSGSWTSWARHSGYEADVMNDREHNYTSSQAPQPEASRRGGQQQEEEAGTSGSDDDEVLQRYSGHRNAQTVKGVAFAGASDEYVVSGSDCGHIFVWAKRSGRLLQMLKGDEDVVNCLEQHPYLPLTLATSGIDSDVKLWSPTAEAPKTLGHREEEVLKRNRDRRQWGGGRLRPFQHAIITPAMLHQLLGLREAAHARRRAVRQPGAADTHQDEEEEEELEEEEVEDQEEHEYDDGQEPVEQQPHPPECSVS